MYLRPRGTDRTVPDDFEAAAMPEQALPCMVVERDGRPVGIVLTIQAEAREGGALAATAIVGMRGADGRMRFWRQSHPDCGEPFAPAMPVECPLGTGHRGHKTFTGLFGMLLGALRPDRPVPVHRLVTVYPIPEPGGPLDAALASYARAADQVVRATGDLIGPAALGVLLGTWWRVPWSVESLDGLDPRLGDAPLARALAMAPEHVDVILEAHDCGMLGPFADRRGLDGAVADYLEGMRAFPRRMLGLVAEAAAVHGSMPDHEVARLGKAMGNRAGGPGLPVAVARLVHRLPGNWRPRGEAGWRSAMRLVGPLAWASSLCRTEAELAAMFPVGDGWAATERRLAAAAGDVHWSMLENAELGVRDMALAFVHEVVVPSRFLAQGRDRDDPVRVADAKAHEAAAFATLFHGRTLARMYALSADWHARQAAMAVAVSALGGGGEGMDWVASLPSLDVGGLRVEVPVTAAQLAWEGTRGLDPAGVPGLDHCVHRYAPRCAAGASRILSVRRRVPGGWERLSTAEVAWDGECVAVVQHAGPRNGPPPVEAEAALEGYLDVVRLRDLAGPAIREPGPVRDGTLAALCGYEWWRPGRWESVRDLWSRYLPRAMRGMGPVAFHDALGDPSEWHVASWRPGRFEPRRPSSRIPAAVATWTRPVSLIPPG